MRFGIALEPTMPIEEAITLAVVGERAGFEYVWVSDDNPSPPSGDVFVTLSALACHTLRVQLGTSICNPYSRHPALIASSILALDKFSQGRIILGLGSGSPHLLSSLGKAWNRPLKTLREAVDACRRLFEGQEVTLHGASFTLQEIQLSPASRRVPIYLGVTRPRALRLAGEIADGVHLTARVPKYMPQAIAHIRTGAEGAGRSMSEIDITTSIVTSISEDRGEAVEAVRETCVYLVAWARPEVLELAGVNRAEQEEVVRAMREEGVKEAGEKLTERMIEEFTCTGTPEDCVHKCREHVEAGASQLIFCVPFGPNPREAIKTLGEQVLPELTR